jgi:hypothetical protein
MRWGHAIGVASMLGLGCYTGAGSSDAGDGADETAGTGADSGGTTTGEPVPEDAIDEIAISGLRRLSVVEYQQTIIDLLGIDAEQAKELLPIDTLTPFDNDYTIQIASEPLIKGLEVIAGDLATTVVETEALRTAIVPCAPTGADDDACFREFITTFGRRALRRPLTTTEIDTYAGLLSYAIEADDFWFGVHAGLRLFLQHPELVYRVEIGEPVPDHPELRRLGDFELAARLSYFTIGSTTPDWLLDAAEQGMLADEGGVTTAAQTLLADDRARARIDRFHALWLRYEQLSAEGIYGNMRDESDALVERIVFDDRTRWTDMLEATETWVTAELAEHYGLPAPSGAAGWVPYGESGRMGLLSHGSFLAVGAKFGDTSPTQRGLLVRTALFCQEIPKPPDDLMVDVDEPPMGSDPDACKIDQYYMWQEPACSGCHALMDPLGFGLEAYDASGAFRTAQPNRPECEISGDGTFYGGPNGDVPFNGPAALATIAVESGEVEACVAKQLYRFAVGRLVLDDHDEALLERLVAESGGAGELEMLGFIERYVASDAFRYRREEDGQ